MTLKPQSQPEYFQKLLDELERAPEKTFSTRLWERIVGYIRFK